MATLTIQVEDNSVMAGLKKVLEAMKGVEKHVRDRRSNG